MKKMKAFSCACYTVGIIAVLAMAGIGLACVWSEESEEMFEYLHRPFYSALILLLTCVAMIFLNGAILRLAGRLRAESRRDYSPPPTSSE